MNLPNTPQGNILIVDDTPANLNILTRLLSERGHTVRSAISSELALKAVDTAHPDVILLDIQMPGLNGFEVCERLKANPMTRTIPVIFISALDAINDKMRAFEVGGVDYITKPFQVLEVLARVESQIRIQLQRRQIEALNAFKDDVIAIVSHDLKNPISIFLSYTQLLRDDVIAGTPVDLEILDRMYQSGTLMFELVQDLLDNARNEQHIPMHFDQASLKELLQGQIFAFDLMAKQKSIRLVTEFSSDNLNVYMDSRRFGQVVGNLISNALKYSPAGGTVVVRSFRENDQAVVEVADSGFGIPAQDLPYIFDKFYRVQREEHLSVEGTGLGLPIAKLIIEEHGGTITAQSELGQGSIFVVTLPLKTIPGLQPT